MVNTPERSGLPLAFLDSPVLIAPRRQQPREDLLGSPCLGSCLRADLIFVVGKLLCDWVISLLTTARVP